MCVEGIPLETGNCDGDYNNERCGAFRSVSDFLIMPSPSFFAIAPFFVVNLVDHEEKLTWIRLFGK